MIGTETRSTSEVKKDARYHYTGVLGDPLTQHLAPPVQEKNLLLQQKSIAHEEKQNVSADMQAMEDRAHWALNDHIHATELDLKKFVNRNVKAEPYRMCLPEGLTGLIEMNPIDKPIAARMFAQRLQQYAPAIAQEHSAVLTSLADAFVLAHQNRLQAEADEAAAFQEEVAARRDVLQQLRINEGLLRAIFPGQLGRVRSYFRPIKRRKAEAKQTAKQTAAGQPNSTSTAEG